MKIGVKQLRGLIKEAIEAHMVGPSYDQSVNPRCMSCDDSGKSLCPSCRGTKCRSCGYIGEVSCKECGGYMTEGDDEEQSPKKEG